MALELRQQLKLSQKLVMTPQLRLAIKLLQMNRLELGDALQAEIEQNPGLEEDVSIQEKRENQQSLSSTIEQKPEQQKEQDHTTQVRAEDTIPETNWEDYANTFDSNVSFSRETPPADAPSQFDFISEKPGLLAYLQWQLAHSDLDPTNGRQRSLSLAISIAMVFWNVHLKRSWQPQTAIMTQQSICLKSFKTLTHLALQQES